MIDKKILDNCNLIKAFDFSKPDLVYREIDKFDEAERMLESVVEKEKEGGKIINE